MTSYVRCQGCLSVGKNCGARMKKHQTLTTFGKASVALAKWLKEEGHLEQDDQTYIENHFLIVQLAYSAWKYGRNKHSREGPVMEG